MYPPPPPAKPLGIRMISAEFCLIPGYPIMVNRKFKIYGGQINEKCIYE